MEQGICDLKTLVSGAGEMSFHSAHQADAGNPWLWHIPVISLW